MKKQWPDVQVGQVWRDRDKRMWSGDRRVLVLSAEPAHDVTYRQVIGPNNRPMGQFFRSRYVRFQRAFEPVSHDVALGVDS